MSNPVIPSALPGCTVLPPMDDGPAPGQKPRRGQTRSKPKGPPPKRSSQGRFQTINGFLDVTMAGLDRAEMAVWLLLWRDTKPDGLARTGQEDLARRAGCTARSVRRALATLQRAGLVEVVRQGGLPRRLSVYRVHPLKTEDVGVRS